MPEEGDLGEVHTSSDSTAGKWLLLAAALIYVAGSLFLLFNLRGRLDQLGKDQAASKTQLADLSSRIQVVEADAETLAHQIGMNKKELTQRAMELQRAQRAAEARSPAGEDDGTRRSKARSTSSPIRRSRGLLMGLDSPT